MCCSAKLQQLKICVPQSSQTSFEVTCPCVGLRKFAIERTRFVNFHRRPLRRHVHAQFCETSNIKSIVFCECASRPSRGQEICRRKVSLSLLGQQRMPTKSRNSVGMSNLVAAAGSPFPNVVLVPLVEPRVFVPDARCENLLARLQNYIGIPSYMRGFLLSASPPPTARAITGDMIHLYLAFRASIQ